MNPPPSTVVSDLEGQTGPEGLVGIRGVPQNDILLVALVAPRIAAEERFMVVLEVVRHIGRCGRVGPSEVYGSVSLLFCLLQDLLDPLNLSD
jgi:hypothetical protein